MSKRSLFLFLAIALVSLSASAQHKKPMGNKSAGPVPDKAFLQKIWDGWSTLNAANQTQFYATGKHTYFDVSPLKYDNWDEYQKTVGKELEEYKSGKFTVNDDAEIHPAGDYVWGSATVSEDATLKNGKHEMATMRWTFIFGKEDGKWVLVHEHVSEPMP